MAREPSSTSAKIMTQTRRDNENDDASSRPPKQKRLKVSKYANESGENDSSSNYVHCPLEVSFQGGPSGEVSGIPPPIELNDASLDNDEDIALMTKIWNHFFQNEPKECKPSPIQQQAWALILKSIPFIGVSPTGSGKTLAYALPTILSSGGGGSSTVLVLAPTRELVHQVAKTYTKLSKSFSKVAGDKSKIKIRVVSIHGGVDRTTQTKELAHSTTSDERRVIVATPGRLLDLIESDRSTKSELANPSWIILDEADQLAKEGDLGPQVDQILEHVRMTSDGSSSKTVLISATYPEKVRARFQEWIGHRYALVKIDSLDKRKVILPSTDFDSAKDQDDTADKDSSQQRSNTSDSTSLGTIPANIEQILHVCAEHKKAKKLIHTLQSIKKEHVGRNHPLGIIFFSKIDKLKYVSKLLLKENVKCLELHGQLPNHVREKNLHLFSVGQVPIILATDIAARGIHVKHIRFVIQYDFPSNLNQYIHRCGRAGRSGDAAKCYSFFTRNLQPMAGDLIKLLHGNNAWIDPNLKALAPGVAEQLLGEGKSSNRKRRRKNNTDAAEKEQTSSSIISNSNDMVAEVAAQDDGDDDDYAELAPNRIVLKRASHVSDASDESSSDEDGDA